jgi:uncharacterized protein (DUF2147 family)
MHHMISRRFFHLTIATAVLPAATLQAGRAGAQATQLTQPTPAGRWQAISDVTAKPSAIVELREVNGQYVGVITALLDAADDSTAVCDQCRGDRHGQRIVGMEILRGMHPDGSSWSGGEILDPETGKTYRATMHLEDAGRKLVVRGYIGVPMFGRSQTWIREPGRP